MPPDDPQAVVTAFEYLKAAILTDDPLVDVRHRTFHELFADHLRLTGQTWVATRKMVDLGESLTGAARKFWMREVDVHLQIFLIGTRWIRIRCVHSSWLPLHPCRRCREREVEAMRREGRYGPRRSSVQ